MPYEKSWKIKNFSGNYSWTLYDNDIHLTKVPSFIKSSEVSNIKGLLVIHEFYRPYQMYLLVNWIHTRTHIGN